MVPTRWSITATDDTLGKNILKRVRNYKWIENFELFFGRVYGKSVFDNDVSWSLEL